MQETVYQVLQYLDLTISAKETEFVHQPAPGKPYDEPTITVSGQKLKVDKFTHDRDLIICSEVTV